MLLSNTQTLLNVLPIACTCRSCYNCVYNFI